MEACNKGRHIINSSTTKKRYLGVELNLISILFSSVAKVLNKFSLVSLNPILGGVLTSAFASLFTLIVILIKFKKVEIVKNKWVILLGLTNAVGVLLQYIALSMLSPVTVTLIAQIYLVYVFLLGFLFLGEKISGWDYVAIIACIAGSMLVSSGRAEFDSAIAIVCAFIYPFMYAANNVIAKYLVKDNNPSDVLLFNHVVSAVLLLVSGFFISGTYSKMPFEGVAFNFGGAFFNGFLSLLLFYISLKYITAGKANIVRALGPLVVIVYSYSFFPISITPKIIWGAILLIIATAIVTFKQNKQEGNE